MWGGGPASPQACICCPLTLPQMTLDLAVLGYAPFLPRGMASPVEAPRWQDPTLSLRQQPIGLA